MANLVGGIVGTGGAPAAGWDVGTFIQNATSTVQGWGGFLLIGLGVLGLILGGTFAMIKLFGNGQNGQQRGWGKIIALVLVGGAFSVGGFQLIKTIGSGGKKTIEDIGNGTGAALFDPTTWQPALTLLGLG